MESELCDQGRATGIRVQGAVLEGAYTAGNDVLLLTTEGTPFEEALHITLLAPDLTVRDTLLVAAPYAPGLLRDIMIVSDTALSFAFFEGQV